MGKGARINISFFKKVTLYSLFIYVTEILIRIFIEPLDTFLIALFNINKIKT